jgi:flagellar protein FliS
MFGASSRPYGAGARYRDIEVAARVQGASPHGLVQIMFDELLKGLDTLAAAEKSSMAWPGAVQSRALSLLHGLEATLDYPRGGEIAVSLGRIYREARRLVATTGTGRAEALTQARDMVGDIAGAWATIGQDQARASAPPHA